MSEAEDLCPVHRRGDGDRRSDLRSRTREGRRGRPGRPPRHGTEHVVADTSLCEACGDCVEACPKEVLSVRGPSFHRHVRFDHPELCRGCGKCVKACPHGAMALRVRPRDDFGTVTAKEAATS